MTLHETAQQIYHLTLGGFINGEKFTYTQFEAALKRWIVHSDRYIIEICLPDGKWLTEITKGTYGLDYWIPDTREQEGRLYEALGIKP